MHLIQSLKNEFCFDFPLFSKYPATSINSYFYKMTLNFISQHWAMFGVNCKPKAMELRKAGLTSSLKEPREMLITLLVFNFVVSSSCKEISVSLQFTSLCCINFFFAGLRNWQNTLLSPEWVQVIMWLTLIGRGFWMLLECGGGLNQPAPSRSPKNTVKNQKKIFGFSESS